LARTAKTFFFCVRKVVFQHLRLHCPRGLQAAPTKMFCVRLFFWGAPPTSHPRITGLSGLQNFGRPGFPAPACRTRREWFLSRAAKTIVLRQKSCFPSFAPALPMGAASCKQKHVLRQISCFCSPRTRHPGITGLSGLQDCGVPGFRALVCRTQRESENMFSDTCA
jgi:hypothetical protein